MKSREHLSRQYATALVRQGAVGADEKTLLAFVGALQAQPRLRAFCASPLIALADKEKFVKSALGGNASQLVLSLVRLLLRHHHIGLLPLIAKDLREQWDAQEGTQSLDVETAVELSAEQRSIIDGMLSKRFGSQVRTSYGVRPELLGGLLIRSRGRVLDETVLGRLESFREELLATNQ